MVVELKIHDFFGFYEQIFTVITTNLLLIQPILW